MNSYLKTKMLYFVLDFKQLNFLSHFYVHQKGNNPLYSAGLVFPDLSRGFVKSPGKQLEENYGELLPLALGCKQHYLADKIFHGSAFFEWGNHECTEAIKSAKFESELERRWFIGHILFELLLDRILVRHQKKVAHDFYMELNLVNEMELRDFIFLHEHQDLDRFLRFFEHFRKVAYIKNYTDNNLFAFSLSRIMLKAGLKPITFADKIVLQECVLELENNQFKNVQSILFELKEVFK